MSWYSPLSTGELRFYRALPKVDLHRHLEGSLRPSTLLEIAQAYQLDFPQDSLAGLVQMQRTDPLSSETFLSKFQTLRRFYQSEEIIRRVARETVLDAADDGVQLLELRFTPVALARAQDFPLGDVMDWVIAESKAAAAERGIEVSLIASCNRHEPLSLAEAVVELAVDRYPQGIVGIDLAGNEAQFSALPFAPLFREAAQSGLQLTIHAGEWGGAENVREAIVDFQASRIGHGVRILEDPSVVALARERDVTLEVCITSNVQSGVSTSLETHPLLELLNAGLRITLNTDDPGVSAISLSDEFRIAIETLRLPPQQVVQLLRNSVEAAFLPAHEKTALLERFNERLSRWFH